MAVTKRTRYEVLKRDNHTCRYCGGTAPDVVLTVDHVTPVSLGGADDPSNLVAACRDCNYGKASTSPDAVLVEDVKQDAIRWAAAIKLAGERATARVEPMRGYMFEMVTEVDQYLDGNYTSLPNDWQESIEQFYRAGLPIESLKHALAVAMSKANVGWTHKWRYACGVAWTIVREIRDEAEAIVREGEN